VKLVLLLVQTLLAVFAFDDRVSTERSIWFQLEAYPRHELLDFLLGEVLYGGVPDDVREGGFPYVRANATSYLAKVVRIEIASCLTNRL
jgi:hypothetical protein